jgi:hypothetical protein
MADIIIELDISTTSEEIDPTIFIYEDIESAGDFDSPLYNEITLTAAATFSPTFRIHAETSLSLANSFFELLDAIQGEIYLTPSVQLATGTAAEEGHIQLDAAVYLKAKVPVEGASISLAGVQDFTGARIALPEPASVSLTPTVQPMKALTKLENFPATSVTITRSATDAMWQLDAEIDGGTGPVEYKHISFERNDYAGVARHLFAGISPDTKHSYQVANNKTAITAYDYGWYLSAQYVPQDMRVMNLDGDKTTWGAWIIALLDETGIIPFRIATCTEASDEEFVFKSTTTKLAAIKEIAEATGYLFTVAWALYGSKYEPAAYFIDPDDIDSSTEGLDLPSPITITWPDDTLVKIDPLQGVADEKINRVIVRGTDGYGNYYTKTLQTTAVTQGDEYPREYMYESGSLKSQSAVDAKCAELFTYYTTDTRIIEVDFTARFDLQLYQRIRFTGAEFPAKLTAAGWFRIIAITYKAGSTEDRVTIRATVDKNMALQQLWGNRYQSDSFSELETTIDAKLSELDLTPMIGTVTAITNETATVETEDGKTLKARLL